MKKLIIALVLCFAAGIASAAEGVRVFQGTSGHKWGELEAHLTAAGAIKDGAFPTGVLANIATEVAKVNGHLGDQKPEQYGAMFIEHNKLGDTITTEEFRRRGQQEGFYLPPMVTKTAAVGFFLPSPHPKTAAVSTASVTVANAPVVATAEEGVVKSDEDRIKAQSSALAVLQSKLDNLAQQSGAKTKTLDQGSVKKLEGDLVAFKEELLKVQQGILSQGGLNNSSREALLARSNELQKRFEAAQAEAQVVIGRVSAVEKEVKGVQSSFIQRYGVGTMAGIAIGLLLLTLFSLAIWRRATAGKLVAEKAVKIASQAVVVAGAARGDSIVAKDQVGKLANRVEIIEATVPLKEFSFNADELKRNLEALDVDAEFSIEFKVDGVSTSLGFVRHYEPFVTIHGIRGQTQPVRIDNVPARIYRAANKGDLEGLAGNTTPLRAVA